VLRTLQTWNVSMEYGTKSRWEKAASIAAVAAPSRAGVMQALGGGVTRTHLAVLDDGEPAHRTPTASPIQGVKVGGLPGAIAQAAVELSNALIQQGIGG
jgi:hypothetical protein